MRWPQGWPQGLVRVGGGVMVKTCNIIEACATKDYTHPNRTHQ